MVGEHLKLALEAILFVASGPLGVQELARVVEAPVGVVEEALEALAADLRGRGIRLQRQGGRLRLVTAPEVAPYVERYLGLKGRQRLSRAALETLAIIAYRQPITRAQIEAMRGVDCQHVLSSLKALGLIGEVGRASLPGRPLLYGTTMKFLEYFGLERPEDLPPLDGLGPAGQHGAE